MVLIKLYVHSWGVNFVWQEWLKGSLIAAETALPHDILMTEQNLKITIVLADLAKYQAYYMKQ
jgi:hypothetical protein